MTQDTLARVPPESRTRDQWESPRPPAYLLVPVFVVVAFLMTFRSLGRVDTHVVGNSGDPLLIMWILGWVQHAIPHGWSEIWNTSIFFPHTNTLAYSDSMISVAFGEWPLRVFFGRALSLNLLSLAAQTASLWFMYALSLRLTRSWRASFVAALAFAFATPLMAHLAHYQLSLTSFLVPLTTLLLVRYLETWKLRYGVGVGLAFAALTTSATYYGLMMACALPVVVVGYLLWYRPRPAWRFLRGLGAGALVAAAITLPVAVQYMSLQDDPYFRRVFDPAGGPFPGDFLSPVGGNYLLGRVGFLDDLAADRGIENRLFPGIVATGFGIAGIVVMVRAIRRRDDSGGVSVFESGRPPPVDNQWRHRVGLLIAGAGLISLVMALGDEMSVFGADVPLPFKVMRKFVPGFSGIRATSRFAVMAECALALCAAFGVKALLARLGKRPAFAAFLVLCAFVLAETAAPVDLVRVPAGRQAEAVGEFLQDRPDGVVAELPIRGPADGAAWPYLEAPRQLLSLIDANERVNGYSGYAPEDFDAIVPVLNEFPSVGALAALDEHHVRYVVLRTRVLGQQFPAEAELLRTDGYGRFTPETARARIAAIPPERLRRVTHVPGAYVVELRPPPRG